MSTITFAGNLAAGQGQDLGDDRRRKRGLARLARLVAQQAVHPFLGEPLLPAPHRRATGAGLPGYVEDRALFRRHQDDVGPLDMLLRTVAVGDNRGQARAVVGAEMNANGLGHARTIAYSAAAVNPLFRSVR